MKVRESRLRDVARVLVWYPGRAMARVLPERAALRAFGRLGDVHALLSPGRPREIASRMTEILGLSEREATDAARSYLRNHYVDRLHILLYPRLVGRGSLPSWLSVAGRPWLDAALASGRGAVVVHPHHAVPQLLPLALGLLGYRCLQIGLPSDEGLSAVGRSVAFRARQDLERLLPARILPADGYLRPAYDVLKEGGVVLVTGDGTGGGRVQGRVEPVPFAGRMLRAPLGPARLARGAGAAILPALVTRRVDGGYEATIDPPFEVPGHGSPERLRSLPAQFAAWFEPRLRADPGAWHFWDELGPGGLLAS